MKRTLEMTFRNEAGKDVVLAVPEPRENLTLSGVKTVMQNIVSKKMFLSKGGFLTEALGAKVRVLEITELA